MTVYRLKYRADHYTPLNRSEESKELEMNSYITKMLTGQRSPDEKAIIKKLRRKYDRH